MDIEFSARRHGIEEDDVWHAIDHSLAFFEFDPGEKPQRFLALGPDRAGDLLEIIVLRDDAGDERVIHAMRMRKSYEGYLP